MGHLFTYEPQPYRPLSRDAYDVLREAIISGRLAPGARIVEAEMARQMAISRAPIREALRQLERDGLIEYRPRRGAVVVALSIEDVKDAYALRAHLEVYAVRLAVARLTAADLAALNDGIETMLACAARDDLTAFISADVAFHARVCQASGSARLQRCWEGLNPYSWTLLTSLRTHEWSLSERAERHRPILAALIAGDPDRAEAVIRHHILELGERVVAGLTARETTDAVPTPVTAPLAPLTRKEA